MLHCTFQQKKLTESRQQLAPLEQQKIKLGHRINDLNASLRSREKKIEQMAKTILELKISKQQLEEENSRHKKSLQQQLSQNSAHRTEREKLRSKNVALSQSNTVNAWSVCRLINIIVHNYNSSEFE